MDKTKAVSVLTDLIKINQDRITAYSRAATLNNSQNLNKLFDEIIMQAAGFVKELQLEIGSYGLSVPPIALPGTKVYKKWRDFDLGFAANNAKQLVSLCEYGEAALEEVYNSALDETGIPANAVIIILKQRRELKTMCNRMKEYRDKQVSSVEAQAV